MTIPEAFGYVVPTEQALETIRRCFAGPINWIDAAPSYGNGALERMIGLVIGELGGQLPAGYVIATKADRELRTGNFSGHQVRRSVMASMDRLGLDHLDLVYLHDPEHVTFEVGAGSGGPLEALCWLRDEGKVGAIGLAGGNVGLMRRYLAVTYFDVLLTHNRYSLLDRSAEALIEEARRYGTAVVNAGVFGGGVLAKGPKLVPRYGYRPASRPILEAAKAMEVCCSSYGVPLRAAALQFSTRDVRIASTIVGVSSPGHVDETVSLYETAIPQGLWGELEGYVPEQAFWLDPEG